MGDVFYPPFIGARPVRPLVFLAGPIQGAPQWQSEAIKYFQDHVPDVDVASPRRPEDSTKLDDAGKHAQAEWEFAYLRTAVVRGVVLFWCPKEVASIPGRAYAQTTRMELGEHLAYLRSGTIYNGVAVGIEPGFTGEWYIKKWISAKTPVVVVQSSLVDTCRQAQMLISIVP